MSTMRPDL